jgi:hypothetical protein
MKHENNPILLAYSKSIINVLILRSETTFRIKRNAILYSSSFQIHMLYVSEVLRWFHPLRLQFHCFHHFFFSYPYDWFPNGILQSSQRKTAEATKPNSSFVLHQVHLQHTH